MNKDLLAFLEKNSFFVIPELLARDLLRAVEDSYLQHLGQLKEVDEEKLKRIPYDYILQERSSQESNNQENIRGFQRRTAKEIYYFLGLLTQRLSKDSKNLVFKDIFSYKMGKILNLSSEHLLITKLTDEFIKWIKEKEYFQAGWGIIQWRDGNILLKEIDKLSEEEIIILTIDKAMVVKKK